MAVVTQPSEFGIDSINFTVPNDKIVILNKEGGEEILKKLRTTPLTSEERAEIKEKARKLRQKPEKK